ncbi:uncharacterized protein LOC124659619 isoform X2 [Lolium rigidum]|uniref:uncharacterized protein LOC124659619 isoform X2 n=1 Tax=Lolium rigidum TaxID=89674 RepID=UPI001F5C23FE|nr:uncharacterized protein LOC124659619 isoform X2 [Lolium rigidum]
MVEDAALLAAATAAACLQTGHVAVSMVLLYRLPRWLPGGAAVHWSSRCTRRHSPCCRHRRLVSNCLTMDTAAVSTELLLPLQRTELSSPLLPPASCCLTIAAASLERGCSSIGGHVAVSMVLWCREVKFRWLSGGGAVHWSSRLPLSLLLPVFREMASTGPWSGAAGASPRSHPSNKIVQETLFDHVLVKRGRRRPTRRLKERSALDPFYFLYVFDLVVLVQVSRTWNWNLYMCSSNYFHSRVSVWLS